MELFELFNRSLSLFEILYSKETGNNTTKNSVPRIILETK
jgi:hypothetical protein